MNETGCKLLTGCAPEPLSGYLKAIGVLRLVAAQADPKVRCSWGGEAFRLHTHLDRAALLDFFLNEYRPTPILAPWNGGSGFWDNKAAGQALTRIRNATSARLAPYVEAIQQAQLVINRNGLRTKPEKATKDRLLRALRSELPDSTLAWLDATTVLTDEAARFAPLLGTGGNDGNLDFTANFMQRLDQVIPLDESLPNNPRPRAQRGRTDPSRAWLEAALFGTGNPALLPAATGQYHPGGVGGANATQGFEGTSLVNPWDYILMLEGTLVFAGAVARRLGGHGRTRASFPFTVTTSAAGSGTLAGSEVQSARAEVWLPLWTQPATMSEVGYLFAEGRAQVGRRQVRTGVDFARAVAGLGVSRGIDTFLRYGFVKRNGLAYLAVPLGRITVRARPHIRLVDHLHPWLDALRSIGRDPQAPARFARTLREVEESVFAYCQRGEPDDLQKVLIAVGRAERVLSVGRKGPGHPAPLLHLSPAWLTACDDGTATYRVAAALASIYHQEIGAVRLQMEPVVWQGSRYTWAPEGPSVTWKGGDLLRNLAAVLERRCLEGARHRLAGLPAAGRIPAALADVHAFLEGLVEDDRLTDLLWGLATLRWAELTDPPKWGGRQAETVPTLSRTYALLKCLFLPTPLRRSPDSPAVRPDLALLSRLRANDVTGAVQIACRRLRAAGFTPLASRHGPPALAVTAAQQPRLAAALLIPVWETEKLKALILPPAAE